MPDSIAWCHHNPVRLVSASLDALALHVSGQNVLLVTTPGFVRRGVTDRIRQLLTTCQTIIWDGVKPNPDLKDLDAATAQLSRKGIDTVIGLGGGSAMDAAKILAVTLSNPAQPTLEQMFRHKKAANLSSRLQLVAIPTTSGTGSEVTPFATVWDHEECKKYSLAGYFVYPDVALLDASLTLTLGKADTLYPALDTVSHALESLWNKNKTPVSEVFATRALALANEGIPAVLQDPSSYDARQKMQVASTLAGIAISQTRTALAHSISYPLTARFYVPHGLACSFTLPRLITHFIECEPASAFAPLMQNTRTLLEEFELDGLLREYASVEAVCALAEEMYAPGRADNFSVAMPDLLAILKK